MLHTATECPDAVRYLQLVVSNSTSLLLPMNFFGSLTLISLTSKTFQILISKHLFPTETLFSSSRSPEDAIGILNPVHLVTAFPCLPSPPALPLRASPKCTHPWRSSRRPLCKLTHKSLHSSSKQWWLVSCWLEPGRQRLQWLRAGSEIRLPRLGSWSHFSLLMSPWASYLKVRSIAFLSYKVGIIRAALLCI